MELKPGLKILLCICAIVLGVHFALTGIYAFPGNALNKPLAAGLYASPFFEQNWNLFVPVPEHRIHIMVKYRIGRALHHYDLFGNAVARHQNNRLAGMEPLVIALSNSVHYLHHSPAESARQKSDMKVLQHIVARYLGNQHGKHPEDLQIMVITIAGGRIRHFS